MRFCIFAYASADGELFEKSVPLAEGAAILRTLGLANAIDIFFMKGADRLGDAYLEKLRHLGYRVHDCERSMAPILDRFPDVARLPPYFAYNYLRWLVPAQMIGEGELELPLAFVDGDIVFVAGLEAIASDLPGKTFVLQGCPCFVTISDVEWFRVYERELRTLFDHPDAYNGDAARVLKEPTRSARESCNALVYKVPLRHDQDLIEYLVGAGKLPQDATSDVFRSRYYWMQNPLFPGEWFVEQSTPSTERRIVENEGMFHVGARTVPFVHFQNDFAWYAHCWMRLHALGLGGLVPLLRHDPRTGERLLPGRVIGGLMRRFDSQHMHYCRRDVYRRSFERNPKSGNLFITDIINSCW